MGKPLNLEQQINQPHKQTIHFEEGLGSIPPPDSPNICRDIRPAVVAMVSRLAALRARGRLRGKRLLLFWWWMMRGSKAAEPRRVLLLHGGL